MTSSTGPAHRTRLDTATLRGLPPLTIHHPPGTFGPTPASRISVRAVAEHRRLLAGTGVDWGTGVGLLALVAARIPGVDRVVGLEIDPANVAAARRNAAANGLEDRVRILEADGFRARDPAGAATLEGLRGTVDFLVANPPLHPGGDGFGCRRRVLAGSAPWLRPGAPVFLGISAQYGEARIRGLESDAPGFRWEGVLVTTPPVPFDLRRPDLLAGLRRYAREESRGGSPYAFLDPANVANTLDARTALARFERGDGSPLSRWQVHLFSWSG